MLKRTYIEDFKRRIKEITEDYYDGKYYNDEHQFVRDITQINTEFEDLLIDYKKEKKYYNNERMMQYCGLIVLAVASFGIGLLLLPYIFFKTLPDEEYYKEIKEIYQFVLNLKIDNNKEKTCIFTQTFKNLNKKHKIFALEIDYNIGKYKKELKIIDYSNTPLYWLNKK